MESYGAIIKNIRMNKGYTQSYVIQNTMTQSSYSKFELYDWEIRFGLLEKIVEKLELSFEELTFIKNDYNYSEREKIIHAFFNMIYSSVEDLQTIIIRAQEF